MAHLSEGATLHPVVAIEKGACAVRGRDMGFHQNDLLLEGMGLQTCTVPPVIPGESAGRPVGGRGVGLLAWEPAIWVGLSGMEQEV